MKYKVGDRVRIKSLDWYNRHTNGTEIDCGKVPFTSGMKWFCSCVMTIRFVHADCYDMVEDLENYYTDEMIEGLVEEESERKLSDESWRYKNIFDRSQCPQSFECPDGYIFKDENGNVINATKIVLEKKRKEYPKTYEECRDYIESCYDEPFCADLVATGYKSKLIESFARLLVCRDAYWKLYGDEMGLGKPWEPTKDKMVYSIYRHSNKIETDMFSGESVTFEFPTKEMRDAFKENFDPDIEICKELL